MLTSPYRHEDPKIREGVITEQEYDTRSKHNIERWVEAHIIPVSPSPKHLLRRD